MGGETVFKMRPQKGGRNPGLLMAKEDQMQTLQGIRSKKKKVGGVGRKREDWGQ